MIEADQHQQSYLGDEAEGRLREGAPGKQAPPSGKSVQEPSESDQSPLPLQYAEHAVEESLYGRVRGDEDRKDDGLFLLQDIKSNLSAANLGGISSKAGVINENEEIRVGEKYHKSLHIKASSLEQLVGNLSGGNQQKVSGA